MAKKLKTLLCVLMLIFGISANAQVTTSAISGVVTNDQNEPVIGATVFAVHQPSGTKYGAVTNIDGRYTIQGMRTGGPYTVTVSYVGNKKVSFTDINLELGNTLQLDAKMQSASQVLDEVVVIGKGKQEAGASKNFSLQKIEGTPTVDRNIYDIVKNMPMAMTNKFGGISFAGSNNRYNSFQIDGTVSNDVFGLASSGTNGGQTSANPISMDAIQEIQVVVAPFDVRQSGFTGGGINAITKQGTNTFHGSAYSYFTNQNLYGQYNATKDYAKDKLTSQHNTTFGGTLSGPIIKDKLFFFLNAENQSQSYPSSYYAGYNPNYLTVEDAQKIVDKYKEYSGFQEGFTSRDVKRNAFSFLGRIDWNINDNNKLAFRYQLNNSYDDNYSPSSSTYMFTNSGYTMKNKTNSFVAELNSHLSQSFYNELRASATFVRDHREIPYMGPNVTIKNTDGVNNIYLGTEYSSGANYLNQDVYTLEDNLSWYKGAHTFTFGTHNEVFRMKNLFIQAAGGSWTFNSLGDFLTDNPAQFTFKYTDPTVTGGDYRYAPVMKAGQFGFYAQDKWDVNRNLQLTYGLRIDIPTLFNSPTTNDDFNTYAADPARNWGVQVGQKPSAKLMFSPRLGFRWYLDEDHNTLLRGGLGLFTGRVPFVWLSNAFTNTGIEQKGTTVYSPSAPSLAKYANDPIAAMNSVTGQAARPDIVTVEKNFRYPQVFRVNLALEQMLPLDIKMTLEGLYSKTYNNVYFQNLAISPNTKTEKVYAVPGVEASAAPYYQVDKKYYSVINLSNTDKGYTYSLSALFEKNFNFGLNAAASYTFGHSKSVYDGTSSVAYSNWKYNYAWDSNHPALSYSQFDVPHRVMVQVGYTTPKYCMDIMQSTLSVIYNGYTGMRYSLTMSEINDYNGDGFYGNSLLYIPTAAEVDQMTFVDNYKKVVDSHTGNTSLKPGMTAAESKAKFIEWLESDKYAKNHRGQYAPRNSCSAPWENRIDLHFAQDFFLVKQIKGSKFQFTFDIINFANMLNKKWGANYSSAYNVTPVQYGTYDPSDAKMKRTINGFVYNGYNEPNKNNIFSRWHGQVGFKLIF